MKTVNKILAITLAMLLAASTFVCADPSLESLQKESEKLQQDMQKTQNALNQVKTQQVKVAKQVEQLDKELNQAESELETVETQLTGLESQIVITKRDLDRATQDADGQKELLKKRVKVMYETGSVGYLSVILESTSFGDLITRLDFLKKIVDYDINLLKSMKLFRDNIAEQKAQLQSELDEKERLKQKLGNKKQQVETAKEDKEKALNELIKDRQKYEKKYEQMLQESKALEKKIIAAQTKEKYKNGKTFWPVPSSHRITSEYGNRIHPILKKKKLHTGIDIGASSGANVVSFNSGTVIFSGYYGGYGYTVIVDHGGQISTLYAHNSKLLVKEGDKVDRGQVISKIGSTGLSTGPHLHFEVRENGQHVDPMKYL